ncbi:hypothetical protein C7N43_08225 [Sphingobacteriales bacterium UPWRP_1]|nr:hypothetical protein B6N25_11160 [Sphingobacteriales bacterium TSM_CSS]PSJ77541.1 hypothetical protein C7N43_08225 [Sphingobacteriales bacterium UPWRP_1]
MVKLIGFLCVLLLLAGACNTVKHLKEGEYLYGGAVVAVKETPNGQSAKKLVAELEYLLNPQPNKKMFGMFRTKLWAYYLGQRHKRGIRGFIGRRFGQPPVLYNPAIPQNNRTQLENYLFNKGYFEANVQYDSTRKNKVIDLTYQLIPNRQYHYNSVVYQTDTGKLGQIIAKSNSESLLKPGNPYNTEQLQAEQNRISRLLHQQGYFDFTPADITFKADTAQQSGTINLFVNPQMQNNGLPFAPYHINNIFVYPEYSALYAATSDADTVVYDNYHFITSQKVVRPAALANKMLLQQGDLYSQKKFEYTLNHLLQIDLFKFVDIKFKKAQPDSAHLLNAYVYLTPDAQRELQVEAEANTVEGYLGSVFNMTYRNRNWFKGAEAFTFNLGTGIETPFGQTFIHTFEINGQAKVQVPKLIVPFRMGKISKYYIPVTNLSVGYSFARRLQQYSIGLANFNFGYDWRAQKSVQHIFNPAFLNFVQLITADSAFLAQLDENPQQKRSFTNQLIFGSNYTYIYSNPPPEGKYRNYLYFKSNVELTGNLAYLLFKTTDNSSSSPHELLGVPFAQYLRLDADLRRFNYLGSRNKQILVTRLVSGIGIPYGNSAVLPYVKQFFTGGSNDLRAFRLRSLGPGVSQAFDTGTNAGNFDRTGDIKLSANIEYRFSLNTYIKGALFADAGNVWLFKGDEDSKFRWNSFYKQFGVGSGVGLRLDLVFFVIRLDWAFPLRTPTQGWVIQKAQPFAKDWRRDNIVWNLAIGYPF